MTEVFVAFQSAEPVSFKMWMGEPSIFLENKLIGRANMESWNDLLQLAKTHDIEPTFRMKIGTVKDELLKKGWVIVPISQGAFPEYWRK